MLIADKYFKKIKNHEMFKKFNPFFGGETSVALVKLGVIFDGMSEDGSFNRDEVIEVVRYALPSDFTLEIFGQIETEIEYIFGWDYSDEHQLPTFTKPKQNPFFKAEESDDF